MFDLELKIQTPDHSRPQAVWSFQSHVIYSIVKPHSLLLLNSGVPFIEFLRANHLKLALNDHVAPGVDLEIQKTRHVAAFEQLATKWQPEAGAVWHRAEPEPSSLCSARRPFPVLVPWQSHPTTPVTRRDSEMRWSQGMALEGCWLPQNQEWKLPAEPSTSSGQGFKAGNPLPPGVFSNSQRLLLPMSNRGAAQRGRWQELLGGEDCQGHKSATAMCKKNHLRNICEHLCLSLIHPINTIVLSQVGFSQKTNKNPKNPTKSPIFIIYLDFVTAHSSMKTELK